MRRWSLRARFLLVLIVLLVGVFAAITFLIVRQNTTTLRNNLITQSRSFAALATQPIGNAFVLYKDSGTLRIDQEIGSFTDLDSDINRVEIIDASGNQVFTNTASGSLKVSADTAAALTPTYLHDKSGSLVAIVQPYVEAFGIHRYDIVYGISYKSINQDIRDIVTSVLALSAGILLLSLVVWYFMINQLFLQPVAQVSQIALLISKGDFDRKVHLGRSDEIGDLATAVDTMASSLKADIDKLKKTDELKSEFLMITSHNLRTPLTIIDGYLEQVKSLKPTKELQDALEPVATNVMRLKGFAEDVLTISTIEAGQMNVQQEPTEMTPILHNISEEFTALAKQKNIKFKSEIETKAWVNLNRGSFRSALWNLLDNAYKFTPEAGNIALMVVTEPEHLKITIEDSGIGIPAAEIPQLFTKFHRATSTLTYNYEGTGIGLYISKIIVEQVGGTISVTSTEGSGAAFTISLPTVAPPAPSASA
jgi:signal transduction histidine kinase